MRVAIVLLIFSLAACGSDPSNSRPDAGGDTDPDAAGDVSTDTEPDGTPDVDPDVSEDTNPDAVADSGPDVIEDTGPDTQPDVAPDTDPDTTPDADAGPDDAMLCADSGGEWLPETCGHWQCGEEPGCRAIIPGCDCGTGRTFVDGEGCATDPTCTGGELCIETGGEWVDDRECGHAECGVFPPASCETPIPSCNCGPGMHYDEELGCADDGFCSQTEEDICTLSGGTWDDGTCGHYNCGVENGCLAIIPGCDCGPDSNYEPRVGCVTMQECGACPDPRNPRVQFVARTAEDCATIFFACDEEQEMFTGACGCGCIDPS